ncbi:MAG: N-acetyltransferase [bacterium]|nr:N-acetyltransferase [bacterium]
MIVRTETPADHEAVRNVHALAFGGPGEAALVDALRAAGKGRVSLVAEVDGEIVGHCLFSPMTVEGDAVVLGLAPVGVLPAWQSRGAGSALIRKGLETCHADAVVVLGHPSYYPRFGFVPASRFGLMSEYDVPDDHFMALELRPGALHDMRGVARYASEFGDL